MLGRTYAAYDKAIFQALLSNDNWNSFYKQTDPNSLWATLLVKIKSHLDVMCPIKYLKVTVNKPLWLTHHIIESLNDHNNLFVAGTDLPILHHLESC